MPEPSSDPEVSQFADALHRDHNARLSARGSSMFPFVLAGSELEVKVVDPKTIKVGDIVCYPDVGQVVAHRVISISEARPGERQFAVRGDAQTRLEQLSQAAVLCVVSRVHHRLFSYDTDGQVGRALARLAVRRGPAVRASAVLLGWLVRAKHAVR